jgi:hypothetical protein
MTPAYLSWLLHATPGARPPSDAAIFAIFFACFAMYFSGVMARRKD